MTPQLRARIRTAMALLLLAGALVVLVLSAMGRFRSMATFPWIFGPVLAAVAGLELVWRRRSATRLQAALLAGAVVAALAAPGAQWLYLRARAGKAERAAMAHLSARPAPGLSWDFVVRGGEPEAAEPRPGRLTVINFWATWCPPCVEELPMLDAWAREHEAAGVRVIGMIRLYREHPDAASERRELAEIESFLEKRGVGYLNLVERGSASHDAYRAAAMPTTVLVGRSGEVLGFGIGRTGAKRILAAAERLLAAERSPPEAAS